MRDVSRTTVAPVANQSTITAENRPDEIAFGDVETGEELTWADFDYRSVQAANAFRDYVGQGDRIVFLSECSVVHTVLWNGALKSGSVVSNLHTRGAPETIRYCLDKLAPQIMVLDATFTDRYRDHLVGETTGAEVVVIGEAEIDGAKSAESFVDGRSGTPPDVSLAEDDLAAIMWTSGTTGTPKGWCFTNRGLIQRGQKMLTDRGGPSPTQLVGLTPSFAAWYSLIMPSLMGGGAIYYIRHWDPERYLKLIEEKRITSLTLLPTMWQEMIRLDAFDEYDLSSLRSVGAAGERLGADTVKLLREKVCDTVANSYAATEAIVTNITFTESNEDAIDELVGTVGRPVPETEVRIVEPDGAPDDVKPPEEVGEIIVRTNDHPVWAWNNTEQNAEAFTDGWWFSGDMGYLDENGYLYLVGRKDFMIMSKGIKVPPGPIEERLNAHSKVDESAVLGVEDVEYGEKVTAVVSVADESVTAEELVEWCLADDSLARYERPREFKFVEEPLPKTVTGKIDRTTTSDEFLAEDG